MPPPDSPVQPIRAGSTSGRVRQPVEGPDAVPGLERDEAQAPAPEAVVEEGVAERLAVVVADHVVQEDDAAELGPADAALLDLGIDPAVLPVAVRAEHAGQLAGLAGRPVEVAAEREPGERLEHDLLDRVAVALELAVDLGVERGLRGASARGRASRASARGRPGRGRARPGPWRGRGSRPLAGSSGRCVRRGSAGRVDRVDPAPDQVEHRRGVEVRVGREREQRGDRHRPGLLFLLFLSCRSLSRSPLPLYLRHGDDELDRLAPGGRPSPIVRQRGAAESPSTFEVRVNVAPSALRSHDCRAGAQTLRVYRPSRGARRRSRQAGELAGREESRTRARARRRPRRPE